MLIELFILYNYTPTHCIPGHIPLGEQIHGAVRESEQVTGLLQLHQERHVYGQTGGVLAVSLEETVLNSVSMSFSLSISFLLFLGILNLEMRLW